MARYFFNGIRTFQLGGKKYGNINVRYKDNKWNFEDPYTWKYGDDLTYYYDTPEGLDYLISTYQDRGGGLGFKVTGGKNIPKEIKDFSWYNGGFDDSPTYGTPDNTTDYFKLYLQQYNNDWSHYNDFEKQQNLKRNELFKKYFPNIEIKD